MRRVLFISNITNHIKAFHLPYLQWFKEQGWEVHVATYGNEEIPYCDIKHNISICRSPYRIANIKAYMQVNSILRKYNFDIIHGHTPVGGVLTRLCGRKHRETGTKVIYTAHGFHFYKGAPFVNWLLYYSIEKWLSKYTDALIVINNEDYVLAQTKLRAKSIHYVHGVGIDIRKFMCPAVSREKKRNEIGIPLDATVLISVGELSREKNHQIVIRALSKASDKNLCYIICGQGKKHNELSTLCDDLGVKERVFMVGYRNDIVDLLHMSDVFVFPSLREGLPVSLVEAMAAGLPCVVSRVRGNVDLITNGKGGITCSANSEQEYRKAIDMIPDCISQKDSVKEYNKSVIDQYDISEVLTQMERIYLESVGE